MRTAILRPRKAIGRGAREAPKRHPRGPKESPRGPKTSPKRPQNCLLGLSWVSLGSPGGPLEDILEDIDQRKGGPFLAAPLKSVVQEGRESIFVAQGGVFEHLSALRGRRDGGHLGRPNRSGNPPSRSRGRG